MTCMPSPPQVWIQDQSTFEVVSWFNVAVSLSPWPLFADSCWSLAAEAMYASHLHGEDDSGEWKGMERINREEDYKKADMDV